MSTERPFEADKTVAMFPGQGSQGQGMAEWLVDNFPSTKQVFEQASDALSIDMLAMCTTESDEVLKKTENTQPALLTTSIATWQVLTGEGGLKSAAFFCGHSLGEYSALVACGKLSFMEAVQCVRKRGQAMQSAVPVGQGAMLAVMRFPSYEKVNEVIGEAKKLFVEGGGSESDFIAEFANYNSPEQIVLSGKADAIDSCADVFKKAGILCKKLPVSAPFHCSMMQPAREAMANVIDALDMTHNDAVMIPNLCGEEVAEYKKSLLLDQITGSVKWTQTLELLMNKGMNEFIEVGSGRVLSGLAAKSAKSWNKQIRVTSTAGESLKAALELIQ